MINHNHTSEIKEPTVAVNDPSPDPPLAWEGAPLPNNHERYNW